MISTSNIDFSIIIFTYNPDLVSIKKVINSIINVIIPKHYFVEYFIIDNNSTSKWLKFFEVEINSLPFQVIHERRQGLTFSRITGFELAKADWIICVDDDNELDPTYLIELKKLIDEYPQVGVWGPGRIEVEYHESAPSWVLNYKGLFQEKSFKGIQYGIEQEWMSYYPPGTGMCLSKKVANAYLNYLEIGKMTASDRKGMALSSGGDSQIVYAGILSGYSAGISPSLSLTHLIGKAKTNLEYMKKLNFAVFSCWPVHIEVFPEMKSLLERPNYVDFVSFFIYHLWKSKFGFDAPRLQIPLAKYIGNIYSYYEVNNLRLPFLYRKIIQLYKLR